MRMTEADLLQRVLDTAERFGWLRVHYRPARTTRGWRTPLIGDPGAPDLLLARRGEVLVAELKGPRGRLSPDQQLWLHALGDHGRLWRPASWSGILAELSAVGVKR